MDIADKTRLSKLLGMLGSSFDGERANAAGMIQKMAEQYKMTITELIAIAHGSTQKTQQQKPPPPPPRPERKPRPSGIFRSDLLYKLGDLLSDDWNGFTDWEEQFASDITEKYSRDYELSEKQLAVVERILSKAERSGYRWDA
jgi:hypothetical protein